MGTGRGEQVEEESVHFLAPPFAPRAKGSPSPVNLGLSGRAWEDGSLPVSVVIITLIPF